MLEIVIPEGEVFNDDTQSFIKIKRCKLRLEHSLLSVSRWESRWEKPFLSKEQKTMEETIDYVKCMTINGGIPEETYLALTQNDYLAIRAYIESPMTATTFSKAFQTKVSREVITSEIIYFWMISQQIPFECEKWHLNRLLTLIKVCSIKNAPEKKRSKRDIMSRNAQINAKRRSKLKSKG